MINTICECCAELADCYEVNSLYLCEKCIKQYEVEIEDYLRSKEKNAN